MKPRPGDVVHAIEALLRQVDGHVRDPAARTALARATALLRGLPGDEAGFALIAENARLAEALRRAGAAPRDPAYPPPEMSPVEAARAARGENERMRAALDRHVAALGEEDLSDSAGLRRELGAILQGAPAPSAPAAGAVSGRAGGEGPRLWFEDLVPGIRFTSASCEVRRDEVVAFARRYDPQPYHVDDAAAAANPLFGRLSASGVHVFALSSRLGSDCCRGAGVALLAGAGVDEMRFALPVFPDDTLHVTVEIVAARPLRSRPDRGLVTFLWSTFNQDGKVVLSFRNDCVCQRRSAD